MDKKEKNDSRDSKRGDYYQALVAIKYAVSESELVEFQKITFEHKGDVSFDNLCQIETKHHKNKITLSDTGEEFWKTLYNWLIQKDSFKRLILHTTSIFPSKSKSFLKSWNKSTPKDRLSILDKIDFGFDLNKIEGYKLFDKNIEILENKMFASDTILKLKRTTKKTFNIQELDELLDSLCITEEEKEIIKIECKDTSDSKFKIWNYYRFLKSCPEEKLQDIISKVEIRTGQANDIELIKELIKHPAFKTLYCKSDKDREIIINERLAGFIASCVVGENHWEISREKFYSTIQQASKDFFNDNYKPIFDKYLEKKPSSEIISKFSDKIFVSELKKIQCETEELNDAIVDNWKTNTLIIEECSNNPLFYNEEYVPFRSNIILPIIKNKKRFFSRSTDELINLKDSLIFYRSTKDMTFINYKSIQCLPYFTHGTILNIVEDTDNDFNLIL